jgi:hypothetical protein
MGSLILVLSLLVATPRLVVAYELETHRRICAHKGPKLTESCLYDADPAVLNALVVGVSQGEDLAASDRAASRTTGARWSRPMVAKIAMVP